MSASALPPSAETAARTALEAKLRELGLGTDQLANQDIPQLQQSLQRIDECIQRPDFTTISAKVMVREYPSGSTRDLAFDVGMLPRLLERKQSILERLGSMSAEQKVEQLLSVVERQSASPERDILQNEIMALRNEGQRWRAEAEAAAEAQRRAELNQRDRLYEVEIFERRSKVLQRFLERESVATIIGALMLFAILIFIGVLAAINRTIPDLVSNTFLIILGYFFGQTVSRVKRHDEKSE